MKASTFPIDVTTVQSFVLLSWPELSQASHLHSRILRLVRLGHQTLGGQVHVDGGKDALGQLVRLERAAELEGRCGIGGRLVAEVYAEEVAERPAILEGGVFRSLVGRAEALLGDVHAQHALQSDGRLSSPLALGIERLPAQPAAQATASQHRSCRKTGRAASPSSWPHIPSQKNLLGKRNPT